MYRQMRGWRHDYKHHIQTMKAHLAMGQYQELDEYLRDLDTDLTEVDTVLHMPAVAPKSLPSSFCCKNG